MEIAFLVALLAALIWMNRSLLGFGGSGCDWMASDLDADDGSRKWLCQTHGTVQITKDGKPPADCPKS